MWSVNIKGMLIRGGRYSYRPAEDTFLLLSNIDRVVISRFRVAYDVCTGSGVIAIYLAYKGMYTIASDVLWDALKDAFNNALLNRVLEGVDVILSESLEALRTDVEDLLITCNPPYLPGSREIEEDLLYIGGENGFETLLEVIMRLRSSFGWMLIAVQSSKGDLRRFEDVLKNLNLEFKAMDKMVVGDETLYLYVVRSGAHQPVSPQYSSL